MAEEAGKPALFFLRLRRKFFFAALWGGRLVQGKVDLGAALRRCHTHRLRGCDADGRGLGGLGVRFRFRLVLGPLPELFPQRRRGQPQGNHDGQYQQQGENRQGGIFGEYRHKAHRQGTGHGAAAVQGHAVGPQGLQHPESGGVVPLGQQHMAQSTGQQRQQQCTGEAQPHRAAMVHQQDQRCHQQSREGQPVAIAKQALENEGQPVQEDGLYAEVADSGTQGHHQQHDAAYLPADGPLLGCAALAGARGCTAALFG